MDFENDILNSWFPNTSDMFSITMEDPNLSFYPSCSINLKVFDFAHQKASIEKEDDFYSVDQKVSTTSQKGKKTSAVQKKSNTSNTTAGKKQPYSKVPISQNKFRITQTIQIKPEWKLIADYNKQSLDKLRLEENKVEFEDLSLCGSLYKISEEYEKDRINPVTSVPLNRYDEVKFYGHISTLQDDRIKSNLDVADIFCTDKILCVIMTMIANSRPWHLKITKIGDSIFIDKPENSDIDLVTTNESDNIPVDDINEKNIDNFKNLAIEATHINEFIKQQIISTENKYDRQTEPHPFSEGTHEENLEKVAYNYRVWTVDDLRILVRGQVHAFNYDEDGNPYFVNVYALNEFDKNSFKNSDNSMSANLRNDLMNNYLKITKFAVQSYLSGVDKIRIGFVSRNNLKDNENHVINGFLDAETDQILSLTNFNKNNAWGILKNIVEIVNKQNDGTYLLMKSLASQKPIIKLLKLPVDSNIDEEDDEF